MARVVAFKTYKKYAKKYGIRSTGKTMRQLKKSIYAHEMKHSSKLFKKKPNKKGDYGLYLVK